MIETKLIYSYPNYSVSSDGVVWVNKTGKPLKQQYQKSSPKTKRGEGYVRVELTKNGKSKKFFVHRLVAEAFIPKTDPNANCVNHKNGIKDDNSVENLEWVTHRQNVDHAVETGLQPKGERIGTSKYKEVQIHQACSLLEKGVNTVNDIADICGLNPNTVYDLRLKRSWKHITKEYKY